MGPPSEPEVRLSIGPFFFWPYYAKMAPKDSQWLREEERNELQGNKQEWEQGAQNEKNQDEQDVDTNASA